MKVLTKYQQAKIPVVNPDTGEEDFVIVQMIEDRELVKVSDLQRYNLFGLTRGLYEKLRCANAITVRTMNGHPRKKGSTHTPYIDLAEFLRDPIEEYNKKKREMKEEVYLSVE